MLTHSVLWLAVGTLVLGLATEGCTKEAESDPANPVAVIKTSKGEIRAELFQEKAPKTVENFVQYAEDGFYAGTIFHRVIPNFMIQGGGFTAEMEEKDTREPIKNEATNGLENEKGTLAMARTAVVDSASAQFFINLKDNDFLNHKNETQQGYGYAVFGRVLEGMDVVETIENVPTGQKDRYQDVPLEPVVIESVEIVK